MVCMGFEPGVAGWKARMNPLSYVLRNCHCRHICQIHNLWMSINNHRVFIRLTNRTKIVPLMAPSISYKQVFVFAEKPRV